MQVTILVGGSLPEILIIICLALALFLASRNFPRVQKEAGKAKEGEKVTGFWRKIFPKDRIDVEAIQSAITSGQEDLIAPVEIDKAKKRFMESDPEILKILYEADEGLRKGDLRLAEDKALLALKKDTRCAQAYVIMGQVAQLRGVLDDAKEAYHTAIKCNEEAGEAYFGLGTILLREENLSEAIEQLAKAVNLDRNEPEWQAMLGRAYTEVRQFAKAAKALKRASSLDIDNKEYRDLALEAEEKQRSHAQAFRK